MRMKISDIVETVLNRVLFVPYIFSQLSIVASLNDGVESWLKRSTSDKEAVDVLHLDKISSIGI